MHDDLRRRALESGKTVSNKAKSKPTSRGSSKANSAANSRPASRIQSRDASDDEDPGNGNLSDDTNLSINSIDQFLESDDFNEKYFEKSFDILRSELQTVIGSLVDRKGTSSSSREAFLTNYIRTLTSHYMAEGLYGHVSEVLGAFSASVKAEATEQEAKLALRAIALTAISYEDDNIYDTVSAVLKRSISDSESLPIKAAAIYSLGICISFGGAAEEEILDVLTFLLEIVSSDGSFIGALDNAEVVAAALHTYGFLATQVEDIEHESEDAISAFLEQLDSDDVRVQVAAGENIALLYEKSYTPREHDDTPSENEDEDSSNDEFDGPRDNSDLVKRYNAYHNTAEVLEKVNALAGISTKSINRRDKRALHSSFTTIAHTIDKPKNGLKTSNASKMVVRIHNEGEMRVDKWWKFMRLNAIRRLLAFGFVNHYFEGNKQVLDALPMIMRATGGSGIASPRKGGASKATKGKYRDSRRFVSGGDFDEST